jgi:penicillin amidase
LRRAAGLVARLLSRLVQLALVLVTLAIVVVMVFGAIITQRGWPETSGTITLDGLHHAVTVVRDRYGIIQITADDRHDLFMAQGYAHAQERMWQMEISRRIGAGRLSELFGVSQVDTDRYVRTLGWRVAAQRDLDAMSPESNAILTAYAEGVNAWISEHNGRLSTPFVVAGLLSGSGGVGGITLEPWTPLDTATWQKVQAWSLGGNLDTEIFRLLADARLGSRAKTDELFPSYDSTAPVITPTGLAGSGGAGAPAGTAAALSSRSSATAAIAASTATAATPPIKLNDANVVALSDLAHIGTAVAELAGFDRGSGLVGSHGVGSNNWVVAGDRTQSGKPILANDPHLGFSMPSVWIMNGLHCREISESCPWDVAGVTFPGAPGVVLGHNARIAWGATNVGPDTQDLFLETPEETDLTRYVYQGRAVPFDIRHETIKVAGGADVELDVRSTRHGVVLSDVDKRLKDGPVLSLRWTTTAEADLALESFFKIDVASDFDEFKAAFDGYGSPSENFIYADVDGHIGYVLPGLIPLREPSTAAACPVDAGCVPTYDRGDRVRDGSSGREEWAGYVPREALPWQLDPKGGQIVSANNAAVDSNYPYYIGDDWDPGYRAQRIIQLLGEVPGKVTADDMRAIQMDTQVLRADAVIPALLSLNPAPATGEGRLLLDRIRGWDHTCDIDSYGCAAYMAVELALQRAIFDDELGPIARDYVGSPFAWKALIGVLLTAGSTWWDSNVAGADGLHDPAGLVASTIDGAAADLRKAHGDPANWHWGTLHQVTFREATLGMSGILPLELYFDPSGRGVAGADGTIDNNYYRIARAYPDPNDPDYKPLGLGEVFEVTNGPSLRFTIDMNDLDAAQIVITTGQSGNPFDSHYGDLIPLWATGLSVALPFSSNNVAASAVQTLTLSPP